MAKNDGKLSYRMCLLIYMVGSTMGILLFASILWGLFSLAETLIAS